MSRKTDLDLGPLPELIGLCAPPRALVVFKISSPPLRRSTFSPAQFAVLTVIERIPGLTQSQVAAALGINEPISSVCSTSSSGPHSPNGGTPRATSVLCALSDRRGCGAGAQAQSPAQGT